MLPGPAPPGLRGTHRGFYCIGKPGNKPKRREEQNTEPVLKKSSGIEACVLPTALNDTTGSAILNNRKTPWMDGPVSGDLFLWDVVDDDKQALGGWSGMGCGLG